MSLSLFVITCHHSLYFLSVLLISCHLELIVVCYCLFVIVCLEHLFLHDLDCNHGLFVSLC